MTSGRLQKILLEKIEDVDTSNRPNQKPPATRGKGKCPRSLTHTYYGTEKAKSKSGKRQD